MSYANNIAKENHNSQDREKDKLSDAHKHTIHNHDEVQASEVCYCICCKTKFPASEVADYVDGRSTALCPHCDTDAVIGDASGITLDEEFLDTLHDQYFGYGDIEAIQGVEVYIATDLLLVDNSYRYNAVYAFKSKRSVKSYEKYLLTTGEQHKLIVTPVMVSDLNHSLNVITEFAMNDKLPEYKSITVFDDYDEARDYKANIRDAHPEIEVEFDIVKIRSRFIPSILHAGFASPLF